MLVNIGALSLCYTSPPNEVGMAVLPSSSTVHIHTRRTYSLSARGADVAIVLCELVPLHIPSSRDLVALLNLLICETFRSSSMMTAIFLTDRSCLVVDFLSCQPLTMRRAYVTQADRQGNRGYPYYDLHFQHVEDPRYSRKEIASVTAYFP